VTLETYIKEAWAWTGGVPRGEQSILGWNFGQVRIVGETILFETGSETAFELPISDIAQVTRSGRNELALEFHLDDTAAKTDECLVEMRFQAPSEEEAAALHAEISARVGPASFAGESLAFFEELPFIVPRGRYDLELYPTYLSMHGKSFDYKILYKTIRRMFLLPKPDEIHLALVISLDPPIRQGNTTYPHLVLQLRREEDEIEIELNMSEEELKKRYGDKLSSKIRGELWQVVSKVLRAVVDKPLHAPKGFVTSQGAHALRTALGANDGYLYPLENCFFFVNKPPTYLRYEDVDFVEFKRLEMDRRFDLQVVLLSGSTLLFTNLERSEFSALYRFLGSKQVRMVGIPPSLLRSATTGKTSMRAAAVRAEMAIAAEEAARRDTEFDEDDEDDDDADQDAHFSGKGDAASDDEDDDEDFAAGDAADAEDGEQDDDDDDDDDDEALEAELEAEEPLGNTEADADVGDAPVPETESPKPMDV
jgi:structure-specific recognition protein 1